MPPGGYMNRGDALGLVLYITVNDEPITQEYADQIELTLNPELQGHSVRKILSDGGIYWEPSEERFIARLTQADTFALKPGTNTWQLRVLKGEMVISTIIGKINVGDANSKRVLTG